MKVHTVETPGLAQLSYLLVSGNDALVVDPRRDVQVYLRLLQEGGLRLRYVLETHRQEDFVLGSAELFRRTGASIVGGTHPNFGHAGIRLGAGQALPLGRLHLLALDTPGHTPESVSYAVFSDDEPDLAWAVFTGDALFAGATGRTDLEDPDRTGENAGLLYDALHSRLLPLGDQALVLAAHGPGSPCGSHIADRQPTTLGQEQRTNPVFRLSRTDFIRHKERERIPQPPYFGRMREVNTHGGLGLPDVEAVPMLPPLEFEKASRLGAVIDTREPEGFAGGHIPGAYSIWKRGLPLFAGWIAESETPLFLVLESERDARDVLLSLARVGFDRIGGILAGGMNAWRRESLPIKTTEAITPTAAADVYDRWQKLDVREITEFEEGHLPGATHLYVGELRGQIERLDLRLDQPVLVTCSIGHRSGLATSILLRHGFTHPYNLLGGMSAWKKQDLPTEAQPEREGEPLTASIGELAEHPPH